MKVLSNCHTHSVFCDGKNTIAEMAEEAYSRGFVSLGFSGHSENEADTEWCLKNAKAYRAEVRRVQAEYAGKMRIWLGLEWDCRSKINPGDYEYTLGATHRMYSEMGEIPVDHSRELLAELLEKYLRGDGEALYRGYYDSVKVAAKQKSPIFAHFDLVRKYNDGNVFFNMDTPDYKKCALEALEAVFESGAVLEINTGAMARGACSTPYPAPFLLDAWHEMGGKVILSSDCHDRRYLDYAFDEAIELARKTGYASILRLGTGTELFEEIGLDD